MQVFILALVLIALAIGGIAIKMFLIPGASFQKKCGSSFDPHTGKEKPCACSSGNPEDCDSWDEENKRTTNLLFRKDDSNQ